MRTKKGFSERFDWTLCLLLMLFCLVSCIAIYSAQGPKDSYLQSQIMWYVIGSITIAIIMYFDNEQIQQITWILYGIGAILLIGLLIAPVTEFTPKRGGAQSWYVIPHLGSIQVSRQFLPGVL